MRILARNKIQAYLPIRRKNLELLFTGFFFLFLISCSSSFDTSSFLSKYINKEIDPGDDFYGFSNGNYNENISPIEKIQKENIQDLIINLQGLLERNDNKHRNLKLLYQSAMDTMARNSSGIDPLVKYIKRIEEIQSLEDLQHVVVFLHQHGYYPFFQIRDEHDKKFSDTILVGLFPPGLGLDKKYFEDTVTNQLIIDKYKEFITKGFCLVGYDNDDVASLVEKVVQVEKKLAYYGFPSDHENKDLLHVYNPFLEHHIERSIKGFIWETYLDSMKIPGYKKFNVYEPAYFRNFDLDKFKVEDLKYYMMWHFIRESLPYLGLTHYQLIEDFHVKLLNEDLPRTLDQIVLSDISSFIPQDISRFYIEENFRDQEIGEETKKIVKLIFSVYENKIRNSIHWMTPASKDLALMKLESMEVSVIQPNWDNNEDIELADTLYFYNVLEIKKSQVQEMLMRINKNVKKNLQVPAHHANVVYDLLRNSLVIPAGILRTPVIEMEHDAENFGILATMITYHITKGITGEGMFVDDEGELRRWWAKSDIKKYQQFHELIEKQCKDYLQVDPLFLKEDSLDNDIINMIISLNISREAFKLYRMQNKELFKDNNIETKSGQLFLLSFANFFGNMEMKTTHSIGDFPLRKKLIINLVVMNFDPFYKDFNVEKQDVLHLQPSQRVRF
ncbi:MAG: M13 family metallopeptidase [Bacteroidota bacterium]